MVDIHEDRMLTHPHRPTTVKGAPARRHNLHTSQYRGPSLENKRNAFVEENNRVVLENDIKQSVYILPRTSSKLGGFAGQLIEKGVITEVDVVQGLDGKKKLARFQTDAKDCTETENNTFKSLNKDTLEYTVDAVVQKYPELRPTTQMMTEPNTAPAMSFNEEHLATRGLPRPISKAAGLKRYRIVSKPPICHLTSFSNVFHVLNDSTKVLEILAKYEWVHRDISAGNVYNYNGDGLLGDLEHAKQVGEGGGHEVLTGTLDFMAAEVLGQRYIVPSEIVVDDKPDTEGKPERSSENDDELDVWADEPDNVIDTPDFTHNPGHDVESVFWLAVFMLFFNRDVSDLEESKEDKADRSACLEYVFSDGILVSGFNRSTILAQPAEFEQRVQWFCKSFKPLINPLFSVIQAMYIAYTKFEGSIGKKKDTDIFLAAHEKAIAMFYKCEMRTRNITIVSYKSRARVVQQGPQPQPEQQADSQRLAESKPDYQQPPVPNASERPPKQEFAPSYVIENTPKYSE